MKGFVRSRAALTSLVSALKLESRKTRLRDLKFQTRGISGLPRGGLGDFPIRGDASLRTMHRVRKLCPVHTFDISLKKQERGYFTNGKVTKANDPYAILGLEWGDGASSADIKAAFRKQARALHPDVNTTDSPEQALAKFQKLQQAYESLMKAVNGADDLDMEEWRVAIWRQSDRIAQDRTDVAGMARKRPVPPASTSTRAYGRELGHPDGKRGNGGPARAEYLSEGNSDKRTSSVGTGRSKWVQPKEFKPWNPTENNLKRASDMLSTSPGKNM